MYAGNIAILVIIGSKCRIENLQIVLKSDRILMISTNQSNFNVVTQPQTIYMGYAVTIAEVLFVVTL